MTNRAPRSSEDGLTDRGSPEVPPESAAPLTPSLVTSTGSESFARAGRAGEELVPEVEEQPNPSSEPSSRELTELAAEDLDSLQGVAASPLGESAEPISEAEEVTADQLIQDDEAPPVPADSVPSRPFDPLERQTPWVDQVADPVTPYEQRASETVKLADLPPVEQLRGRVLANRYLAEELAEQTPGSLSYRAYHLALDRAVTVRVLPRGLACSDELCQEVRSAARVASSLNHANVAVTLDFAVTTDGWPFLVTEVVQGRSLAVLLAEEGKFVLRRVLHIGKQLAAGLGAAHQAGLVHGLLAPDHVMVIEPGTSAEVASIVGFGVHAARGPNPAPPRSGVFGVPFYVSPEQASCRSLDARSDLYSVGVILYELMTGAPPFSDGDFAAVLCQHLDDDAEPPSARLPSPGALAKAMDAIIERCLRKDPEQRYQTAAELADDLLRLEAAAARNKRRPMPEIQRPTTTIHSPPPRADSSHGAQGAKVIVHDGDPDDARSETPSSPGGEGRGSSPGSTPPAPRVAVRSAVTAAPRSALGGSGAAAGGSAGSSPAGSTAAASTAAGSTAAASSLTGSNLAGSHVPGSHAAGGNVAGGNVAGGNVAGGNVAGGNVVGGGLASGARRPLRVSVDQATIKISAIDRELAMALHRKHNVKHSWNAAPQGVVAALTASLALAWHWVVRLFGGGSTGATQTDSRDDSRGG